MLKERAVCILLFVCTFSIVSAFAQPSARPDPLAALSFLEGGWRGETKGQSGTGTVEREYTWVLGGRFLQVRNTSRYPAQEKNPKGEVHEDIGYFSFDSARKQFVFRQFHAEGFVNQYLGGEVDHVAPPGTPRRFVFRSESIENIPTGWRARETYVAIGPDEIEEVFELAAPDKDFEVYSTSRLKRVR